MTTNGIMIESVAVRQRGAYDFEGHYNNLCALQSSCPIPAVKAHLGERVLDINGDRIRAVDWMPVLGSLRINKTLEFVAVRSFFQKTLDEQEGRNYKHKTPAIRSKEITYRLCKAMKDCLVVTPCLTCVELQGLPLRLRDLESLAKGIYHNKTLQHLSLEHSGIGDEGLEALSKGVRNSKSVSSLNFSGCGLTTQGAETMAKIIKHQAMKRHNEAWQDSLRYRRPDLDRMSGIRRISINSNPMMGDQAAKLLADALKDDLWLKALDMQHCGLTDVGAHHFLGTLKFNTCLVVLDIRQNPMTDQDLVKKIIEHLHINSYGNETEYKWIKAEPLGGEQGSGGKGKKKRTKTLQTNFRKRTTIKVSSGRRRSRSVGTPTRVQSCQAAEAAEPGLPWRTALRANRFKGYPPDRSPGKTHMEVLADEDGDETTIKISPAKSRLVESEDETLNSTHALRGTVSDTDVSSLKDMRSVKVEIEQLRRLLREETRARARADERIIELTVENNRLKGEIDDYRAKQGILDDDAVLDSIEKSFQQFHQFLELLREAGLGQLIKLAGIDQEAMPFNANAGRPSIDGIEPNSREARLLNLTNGVGVNGSMLQPNDTFTSPPPPPVHDEPTFSDNFQHMVRQANAGRGVTYNKGTGAPANMADAASTEGSKFDQLYAKAMQETEGKLSGAANMESGEPAVHMNGSHGGSKQTASKAGIDVSAPALSDGGSARSGHSHSSHRPMQIEDLMQPGSQDQLPGSQGQLPGSQGSRGQGQGSRKSEASHGYTESFEKDDSEESDIEELLEMSGNSSPEKDGIHIGSDDASF